MCVVLCRMFVSSTIEKLTHHDLWTVLIFQLMFASGDFLLLLRLALKRVAGYKAVWKHLLLDFWSNYRNFEFYNVINICECIQ